MIFQDMKKERMEELNDSWLIELTIQFILLEAIPSKRIMTKLSLSRVDPAKAPTLELFKDHTIFQTFQWLQFISSTQNAEPIVAVLKDGNQTVGRFTGLIVRKYGLRILGSPFAGWTTSYMGFNLKPFVSRIDAFLALEDFAFSDLKCAHFEVMDRHLSVEDAQRLGHPYSVHPGFEIDLTKDEDELFSGMKPACRRCIRKATKSGVEIEEAKDLSFVDDYYAQLLDVFAKQKLVPTYSKERVQALVEHLLPTGRLLLLRARNVEGTCIATGIFPATENTMYFWGGASWRPYQILRPNEAIQWFAMRYWKARGVTRYDMGGGGGYKRKYGGNKIGVPWVRKSKFQIHGYLRNRAKNLSRFKRRVYGLRSR